MHSGCRTPGLMTQHVERSRSFRPSMTLVLRSSGSWPDRPASASADLRDDDPASDAMARPRIGRAAAARPGGRVRSLGSAPRSGGSLRRVDGPGSSGGLPQRVRDAARRQSRWLSAAELLSAGNVCETSDVVISWWQRDISRGALTSRALVSPHTTRLQAADIRPDRSIITSHRPWLVGQRDVSTCCELRRSGWHDLWSRWS